MEEEAREARISAAQHLRASRSLHAHSKHSSLSYGRREQGYRLHAELLAVRRRDVLQRSHVREVRRRCSRMPGDVPLAPPAATLDACNDCITRLRTPRAIIEVVRGEGRGVEQHAHAGAA